MIFSTDPYDSHVDAVVAVASAGGTVPTEWTELRQRFEDFTYISRPALAQLSAAITSGQTADIGTLRALALAEVTATPPNEAEVTATVRGATLLKLRDIYGEHAATNYEHLAAEFTTVAAKFTAAAAVVDPETPSAEMVSAADKPRKAWLDAEQLAHQLTSLLAALQSAASLTGTRASRDEELIPLTVDTAALHRRRVWECWRTEGGRTGRWGALAGIGANIRAATLGDFTAYRQPAPLQEKWLRSGMGHRRVIIDPEDATAEVAETA